MDTFASRLRAFRTARGWTQEHVGFELGVTKATVSKWEGGRAEPGLRNLAALLRLFAPDGMTLDYLIGGVPRSGEPRSPDHFEANPARLACDSDEAVMLLRFRRLGAKKRKGLLALIEG